MNLGDDKCFQRCENDVVGEAFRHLLSAHHSPMKTDKVKLQSLRGTQRIVALRMAERRFVASVAAMKPTVDDERRAAELVTRVQQAKKADFLDQYRVAA